MASDFLKDIDSTWTLFLDRDGVINQRIFGGYVKNTDEFVFLPEVLESIAYFSSIFSRIIVITNQQGVGKGIMSETELNQLHKHMSLSISNAGGRVDAVYFCTELATSPNNCRKPSNFMAQRALSDFPEITLSKSIMVGDSISDIEFGLNSGMKTVFVSNSNDKLKYIQSDMIIKSLSSLKTMIQQLTH